MVVAHHLFLKNSFNVETGYQWVFQYITFIIPVSPLIIYGRSKYDNGRQNNGEQIDPCLAVGR